MSLTQNHETNKLRQLLNEKLGLGMPIWQCLCFVHLQFLFQIAKVIRPFAQSCGGEKKRYSELRMTCLLVWKKQAQSLILIKKSITLLFLAHSLCNDRIKPVHQFLVGGEYVPIWSRMVKKPDIALKIKYIKGKDIE